MPGCRSLARRRALSGRWTLLLARRRALSGRWTLLLTRWRALARGWSLLLPWGRSLLLTRRGLVGLAAGKGFL